MTTAASPNKPIPSISIESQLLIKMLEGTTEGGIVTYGAMTTELGRDVRKCAYFAIQTARTRMLNDHGIVFETVRGIGLKRLSDVEVVDVGQSGLNRIRRACRKTLKKITAISDFDGMPPDVRLRHNVTATLLHFMDKAGSKKNTQRIEDAVQQTQGVLPLQKTLDAFKSNGK